MNTTLQSLFYNLINSALIAFLFSVITYWYITKKCNYWKDKGIPYVKPYPYFIYFFKMCRQGIEAVELERYQKYGRIYGFNEGSTPLISVGDPELIKTMLVRDFHYFTDKRLPARYTTVGINNIPIGDPVADKMLSNIRGDTWRRIKTIVAKAFSTGRISRVKYIIHESAKTLLENLKLEMANKNSVELIRMFGGFSMDVITKTAFSTNVDSLKNPNNVVVRKAKAASNPNLKPHFVLIYYIPKIMKLFGFELFSKENKFFHELFQEVIEERRITGQTRNDFLQILMDIADKNETEKSDETDDDFIDTCNYGDSDETVLKSDVSQHLSMDEIISQCVIFLLGGYHSTKLVMSAVTYLLAVHQDEQEKVFNEIKEVLRETDGVLTYEAIQKIKYLDNVISEALRLHPPSTKIERQVAIDYKLGNTGITIPRGMAVSVPICAIHTDPEFFPEPEKFKPSRFSPKERENLIPYTYIPFGVGPRNCVGMHFALLELKICLAYVFSVFHAQECPQAKGPLRREKGIGSMNLAPVHMRFVERKDCPLVL